MSKPITSSEMTAKELHAIYSPLWEKVPAARPEDIDFGSGRWWRLYNDPDPGCINPMRRDMWDDEAAALCRVAAEDWLRNHDRVPFVILTDDAPVSIAVCGRWNGGRYIAPPGSLSDALGETEFDGPAIHHALVAACLAVAGVKA